MRTVHFLAGAIGFWVVATLNPNLLGLFAIVLIATIGAHVLEKVLRHLGVIK